MTSRTTPLRHAVRAPVGVVLLILAVSLAGCVPADPAAAPTPSFSNEAEAFAAAEATYREYVKALNAVDLSDPETFEGVYAWTTGEANAGARESFTQMHANGWAVSGTTTAARIEATRPTSPRSGLIYIAVCLDVSAVEVTDEGGQSVVQEGRSDQQAMLVALIPDAKSPTLLLIADISGREGEPRCGE